MVDFFSFPDLQTLNSELKRYGVRTKGWGTRGPTKSSEYLAQECVKGETRFFLKKGKGKQELWRKTERSKGLLLYNHPQEGLLRLTEVKTVFGNGSVLPGSKSASMSGKRGWALKPPEAWDDALIREMEEEQGIEGLEKSRIIPLRSKRSKTALSTRSYPTLPTESVDKHFLVLLSDENYEMMRLEERQPEKVTTWQWEPYRGPSIGMLIK